MSARYFLDERNLLSLGLSPQNIITFRALAGLLNVQNAVTEIQGETGLLASDGAGAITGRTLTAGTGISVTNGTGVSGNPTVAADAEYIRDTIGTALTEGAGIDITVNDAGDTIAVAVASDAAAANLLTTLGGDPNADRIVFWDDSAGAFAFLRANTGLTVSGTDLNASGGGSGTSYEAGPITAPVVADFSTVNAGTMTYSDGTGGLTALLDNDGEAHLLVKSAPSTPYNVYMRVETFITSSAANTTNIFDQCGICLRDATNGDFLTWYVSKERVSGDEQDLYMYGLTRWTNATTTSSTPLLRFGMTTLKWLRIANDGTTITLYGSLDGKDWVSIGTETIATFVGTIDQIGMSFRGSSNNTLTFAKVGYFSTTAPS